MANNLFVTYDLGDASYDRYQEFHAAIEALGTAVHLEYSVFYLLTTLDQSQVLERLKPKIKKGEKLLVITAKNAIGHGHGERWEQLRGLWETK